MIYGNLKGEFIICAGGINNITHFFNNNVLVPIENFDKFNPTIFTYEGNSKKFYLLSDGLYLTSDLTYRKKKEEFKIIFSAVDRVPRRDILSGTPYVLSFYMNQEYRMFWPVKNSHRTDLVTFIPLKFFDKSGKVNEGLKDLYSSIIDINFRGCTSMEWCKPVSMNVCSTNGNCGSCLGFCELSEMCVPNNTSEPISYTCIPEIQDVASSGSIGVSWSNPQIVGNGATFFALFLIVVIVIFCTWFVMYFSKVV